MQIVGYINTNKVISKVSTLIICVENIWRNEHPRDKEHFYWARRYRRRILSGADAAMQEEIPLFVLWVVNWLPCVVFCWNVHIAVFTLDAGPLAKCQCSEGPATDHLDTGFLSWFPCVLKTNAELVPKYPRCHYLLPM